MENAMQCIPFESLEFGTIDVMLVEGEPYFLASDVCRALDVGKTAASRLDDDEKGLRSTQTLGGNQQKLYVTESGLYSLVFKSRKPEAQAFRKWVTGTVLPSIRHDSGYMVSLPEETPEQTMARAVLIATATIERQKSQLLGANDKIAKLEPKAAYADSIFDDTKSMSMTEAARQLYQLDGHMTCADLYALMRAREMICKGSKAPTKQAIAQGLLVQRKGTYAGGTKTYEAYSRVTMKGLKWMAEHFCAQQVLGMEAQS